MKRGTVFCALCISLILLAACGPGRKIGFSDGRFLVGERELFMSGMNLAWINFGRDITGFDERKFVRALDDVAGAGGNCLRWWIHVNGSASPDFDENKRVSGLPLDFTERLRRALDLARERGVMLVLSLWSFDMLKNQGGVDLDANQKMLSDPEYIRAYIDRALVPMVRGLAGHPALLCYEIFNEPEGMLSTGWTDRRTSLVYIQRFINLTAGAIHRADPAALVTVGSVLAMFANVDGYENKYADEALIRAGGDELGVLDFYEAHFYPEWEDESTSPFHHPASYWNLDKPILIGEFPAKGIRDIGKGFRPKTTLASEEAYLWAFENGYAGALAWTWTAHDGFGGVPDASPGMQALAALYPENIDLTP